MRSLGKCEGHVLGCGGVLSGLRKCAKYRDNAGVVVVGFGKYKKRMMGIL